MKPDEVEPGKYYLSKMNHVYLGTIDKRLVHLRTGNFIPPPLHAHCRAWAFMKPALEDEVLRFLKTCPGAQLLKRPPGDGFSLAMDEAPPELKDRRPFDGSPKPPLLPSHLQDCQIGNNWKDCPACKGLMI